MTEFEPKDWTIHTGDRSSSWSEQAFADMVPLTPDAYRRERETDLNEWREAAGLPVKRIHSMTPVMRDLQDAAGIKP